MVPWPTILPRLLIASFSYRLVDTAAVIDTEIGEGLSRNRFTGNLAEVTGTLSLDEAQKLRLLAFWRHDLVRGALRFSIDDPLTDEASEAMFLRAPGPWAQVGAARWRAEIALRLFK